MGKPPLQGISRRELVAAGMTAALPMSAHAAAAADPRDSALGQIKMLGSLDGSAAYWIYSGTVYAVRPKTHPTAILRVSGCQSVWTQQQPDKSYIATGAILTYFRDVASGRILDRFDNPFSGQRNEVKFNFLSGARTRYPADGSSAHADFIPAGGGAIAPDGFGKAEAQRPLGRVTWRDMADIMMLQTDRSWNVAAQPQLEAATQTCSKADFFDSSEKRMKARYAGTTIIPWMGWMEMQDMPGHLVWHTSGEKAFNLDSLEDDYRARAGSLLDHLTQPV